MVVTTKKIKIKHPTHKTNAHEPTISTHIKSWLDVCDVPHCCERKAQSQLICRGKPAAC